MPRQVPHQSDPAPDTQFKWCHHCGEKKPLEDFDLDQSKEDGRKNHCKPCRKEMRESEQAAKVDPRLIEAEKESLEILDQLNKGGSFVPHQSEMLESMMRTFGGVDGFSKIVKSTFHRLSPGSPQRVKLLMKIMDFAQKNSMAGHADDALDELQEADIKKIIAQLIKQHPEAVGSLAQPSQPHQHTIEVTPKPTEKIQEDGPEGTE